MREICIFEKTNNLEEDQQNILNYAIEFWEREKDYETETGEFLGNLKFYPNIIFENEDSARDYLENLEQYDDQVVLLFKENNQLFWMSKVDC